MKNGHMVASETVLAAFTKVHCRGEENTRSSWEIPMI